MINIIGNAPSSGSSFLADLLDSTPYSACGPEINIFSNKGIYNFGEYKKNIYQTSKTSTYCLLRNGTNFHRLYSYGLNIAEYKNLMNEANNLDKFIRSFAENFLALRGKNDDAIFFEKTPQNLNCLGEFLNHFKDSYFIHIVRNPIYVYPSLLKRGIPKYISLLTWLIDVAKYFKYKENSRVVLIKYEDLVEKPFKMASDLLKKISKKEVSESEIESGFKNNRYRKFHSKKISSWTIPQYGVVWDANKQKLNPEHLMDFSKLFNAKLNSTFANIFNLAEISFLDAVREFGYYNEIIKELNSINLSSELPLKSSKDKKRLYYKWFRDFIAREANIAHLRYYLNPIEKCAE